jgi:hypothetical protein
MVQQWLVLEWQSSIMHVEEEKKNYGRFINVSSRHQHTIVTPGLFFVAALLEIGVGYWNCNGLGKKEFLWD